MRRDPEELKRLREELSPMGITVLAQDIDGSPNQLVERMKRDPRTVVLGHGGHDAIQWFKDNIHTRHPKMRIFAPASGDTVEA